MLLEESKRIGVVQTKTLRQTGKLGNGYFLKNHLYYYSTNCNTIQIWSLCSRYLSSVGNRYPAIYVASYVGRKSEVEKCRQKDLKMLRAVLSSIC